MDIPIYRKILLTIEETSKYSNIGENRIREIIAENPNADFVLTKGTHILIKRERFEQYVLKQSMI